MRGKAWSPRAKARVDWVTQNTQRNPTRTVGVVLQGGSVRPGERPAVRHDPAGALCVHRAREQEALAELAAQLLQHGELRLGLDALGEHLLAERLAELEDGAHDLVAVALG